MGTLGQSKTFFTLWYLNTSWIAQTIYLFVTLFFLTPITTVLISIVASAGRGAALTFGLLSNLFMVYTVIGDVLSFGVNIIIRIVTPFCWTIVLLFTGFDLPGTVAAIFRLIWRALLFIAIFGTFAAVFTWWGFQNETLQVIDAVYCQTIPFQQPFCDLYNDIKDLYETFVPPVNLVLDIIYDFLRMIFEGLVRLVFTGFGLLVRFFSDPTSLDNCPCIPIPGLVSCPPGSLPSNQPFCVTSGDPNAPDQCIVQEFACYVADVVNFIVKDIFGGILRLFFGNAVTNFLLRVLCGLLDSLVLLVDLAASIFNPSFLSGCNGAVAIGPSTTANTAYQCFTNRTRCPVNRLICWYWFWFRVIFGSLSQLFSFIFDIIDVFTEPIFQFKVGTALETFIGILETILDFFVDLANTIKNFLAPVLGQLENVRNIANNALNKVLDVIRDPFGAISSFASKIISAITDPEKIVTLVSAIIEEVISQLGFGDVLADIAEIFQYIPPSIPGFGGGSGGIADAAGGVVDFVSSPFRRRRLLDHSTQNYTIPVVFSNEYLDYVSERIGRSPSEVQTILEMYEIFNNTLKTECGVSSFCIDVLTSVDGIPSYHNLTVDDFFTNDEAYCTLQYLQTRRYYQEHMNETTHPSYHLATFSTWLPDDDYCKPVLERDLLAHIDPLEIQQKENYERDSWWWSEYAPCAHLYYTSFTTEYRVIANTTDETNGEILEDYFERPTEWKTKDMENPTRKSTEETFIRLLLIPYQILPYKSSYSAGYRVLHAAHSSLLFLTQHNVPHEKMLEQRRDAYIHMTNPLETFHTIGGYSVYADKRDENGKVIRGLNHYVDPVHKKLSEFSWSKTFGQSFRNWRNPEYRESLRQNRTQMSVAGTVRVLGGFPRLRKVVTERPWKRASVQLPQRHLSQLAERDFNLNDIIFNAGSFIGDVFIFFFQTLVTVLRRFRFPGAEEAEMALNFVIETIATFDYDTLLDTIFDFVLSYFLDAIESFDCSAPLWYDARDNPNGDWKCQCLLQLKLPITWPEWPDFRIRRIPWGFPCRGEPGLCGWSGGFPTFEIPGNLFSQVPFPLVNQLPCEAGYRLCSEIGFSDGFDIQIYFTELVSIESGIDVIGFLRSDEFGLIVALTIGTTALIIYPIALVLGFGDSVLDFIGPTTIRDMPLFGPVVFRFEGFQEFPTGPFYDACILWGYALVLLSFIITLFVLITLGLYLVYVPRIFFAILNLILRSLTLPFLAILSVDTERFKQRWDDPVWVYEQDEDLYDDEFGAISFAPLKKGGSEVETSEIGRALYTADIERFNKTP